MKFIMILLLIIIVSEIVTFIAYGWFLPKHIEQILFKNVDESKLRLNQFDSSIIMTSPYIAKIGWSLFSKYHIDGWWTVPRWSKLSKRIDQYYIIALMNGNKVDN